MADLTLPTRNVVSLVSHNDQRMIKWFEDTSAAVSALVSSGVGGGGGGTLNMGSRVGGDTLLQFGARA